MRHTACHRLAMCYRAVAVVLAALLLATCNLIAGTGELQPREAPVIKCQTDEDCAEVCHQVSCVDHACVATPLPAGTPCSDGSCDTPGSCDCPPEGCPQERCDANGSCRCPLEGCANGHPCNYDRDCASHYCKSGSCAPSPCPTPCPGVCWQCTAGGCAPVPPGDTVGELCPLGCDGAGACPSCDNGLLDGAETDTDCGGPGCDPCADGQTCVFAADCASCICAGVGADARCAPAQCGNDKQDGCESDVDCGGACGSTCAAGEKCHAKSDCASHWCVSGTCKEMAG